MVTGLCIHSEGWYMGLACTLKLSMGCQETIPLLPLTQLGLSFEF